MALSHCWGGKLQNRTTRATLEKHQRNIDPGQLSKTIRDACQTAKSIGIRYLWVDSLCIIQEDVEDFARESCKMASVYEQACCVIAATAAPDGTVGLFQRTTSQCLAMLPCDPKRPEQGNMYFGFQNDHFSRQDDQVQEDSLFHSPLNKRGWVLQERLFARRIIHFGEDQMYWECDKIFVGEDNSDLTGAADLTIYTRSLFCNIIDDFRGFRRNPKSTDKFHYVRDDQLHSLWAGLVTAYSRCGLSDPNDKLPALQSLTSELASILNLPFHEGHLFDDTRMVLSDLLWRAAKGHSLVKPRQPRAPSWSWASMDGPIDFADLGLDDMVLKCYVYWHHPAPHDLEILRVREYRPPGRQSGKALPCSGVALECSRSRDATVAENRFRWFIDWTRLKKPSTRFMQSVYTTDGNVISAELEFDIIDNRPIQFHLIPLFVRWRKEDAPVNYCLMVKKIGQGRIFERIGMGWVNDLSCFDHVEKKFLVLI